jgi:hypothetical protein
MRLSSTVAANLLQELRDGSLMLQLCYRSPLPGKHAATSCYTPGAAGAARRLDTVDIFRGTGMAGAEC